MSRNKVLMGATSLAGLLAVSAILFAMPAQAQDVNRLERELDSMQREMQELRREITEAKAKAAEDEQKATTAEEAAKSDPGIKVKWKGAPEIASEDGSFKMKMRGRVMADTAFIDQDEDVTGVPDVDASEFRRARLGIEGVVWSDVKYKFEIDFADNDTSITDAYLQYKGWPVGLTFGQFKTPNSLEEQTSSRYITFLERASITDAFELARQIGIGVGYAEKYWTVKGGVFRGDADGRDNRDDGETLALRGTVAPINSENTVVHLGAHVRQRDVGDPMANDLFRYRQRPHLHLADRFVATPRIAEEDTLYGFEFAWVQGPFSAQAEYMTLDAETPVGDDPSFDGFYVDASYFLTGESRLYDEGEFDRVKVRHPVFEGGYGAWQLALRYDNINLTDDPVIGGEQDTIIAGVNWHLNDHVRFMLNYSMSEVDGGANDNAEIDGFGLRAQVDW